ncbi:IS66 family transposase [Portibacter marinus]|uniref:IS66 family transposase n=1 Tax=Portibacter marinus TaxID=2898660 RepID=UPI001F31E400|nr:IS66 family transposase [Portibacter marinus]
MTDGEIITELRKKNARLEHELAELKRLIYGYKKERFIPNSPSVEQLHLFGQSAEDKTDIDSVLSDESSNSTKQNKKVTHPGRNPIPDHFPFKEETLRPEGDLADMVIIGQEVTETVDYTPASLVKKRIVRPRYVSKDGQRVLIACLPDRPMPKCIAEPSLIAWMQVRKFVEHMPYYRQIQQIKRDYRWELSSSTVGNWFTQLCDLLTPLYNEMKAQIQNSIYLQVDESPIKVQDSVKKGSTHQGYQWVYHNPESGLVLFDYRKGRGRAGPKELLEKYKGVIQCDGWQVYDKIAKSKPDIELAGCMAHVRRKFYEAKNTNKQLAEYALSVIQEVYKQERLAKQSLDRKQYRDDHIVPLIQKLREWVDLKSTEVLPKSPIGKAMTYLVKQWPKIETIFADARIELDNNLIENKIRPLALGRKNYLFAGSHQAAQRIAMMYSFFGTCKANDVNPYQWLKSTIEIISETKLDQLASLLPVKL